MTNLTHEQLVEKVACSIFKSIGAEDPYMRVRGGKPAWTLWEGMARAAIAVIYAETAEPTEEILDAYWHRSGESSEMRSRVHDRARCYYAGMRLASPLNPDGK